MVSSPSFTDEVTRVLAGDNHTDAISLAFRTALGLVPRDGLIGKQYKVNRACIK